MFLPAAAITFETPIAYPDGWRLTRSEAKSGAICTIAVDQIGGTTIALMIDGQASQPTLFLINDAWRSLAGKDEVDVETVLDGERRAGTMSAGMIDGHAYLKADIPWDTLSGKRVLTIRYRDRALTEVTGSYLAIAALRGCSSGASDPFAK